VLGSAVAFSLYNWALTQVSTVAAGVSLTLIPVFGVAFSLALLSEPVTLATLAAAVAVIVGVVASVEPEPKPPAPMETGTLVGHLSPCSDLARMES
jgi:drug/metabolite transporter (DMT)-like permease